MTSEQRQLEIIMLISISKLLSDQSTHLLGELNHDLKHDFNVMVKSTDRFIARCEKLLSTENNLCLQEITDALNNKVTNIRTEIAELK